MEKQKIVWGLADPGKEKSAVDVELAKHEKRAEKFGIPVVDPKDRVDMVLEVRKSRLAKEGFSTGVDVFAEEEVQKQMARAARFGLPVSSIAYQKDEEEQQKKKRAQRFKTQYQGPSADTALMDMDLLETKKDVDKEVERREDAVYLYGVDVMSTTDVLQYFGDYGPTFVEWIDDSSCVVQFRDSLSTRRAIVGLGQPLDAEEEEALQADTSSDPGPSGTTPPIDPDVVTYKWHKGKDFLKHQTPVNLMLRMATVMDKKDSSAPPRSRELWKVVETARHSRAKIQWKAPGTKGVQKKKKVEEVEVTPVAEEGDVKMKRTRGKRGGKKVRMREMLLTGVADMDMDGAADSPAGDEVQAGTSMVGDCEGVDDGGGDARLARLGVTDLRQLLADKNPIGGRFSAAAAGVGAGAPMGAG